MVRLYEERDENIHGELVLEHHTTGTLVEIFFIPPPVKLAESGFDPDQAATHRRKLIELDTDSGRFTIFPLTTISSTSRFLEPKYRQIRKITLADGKLVLSARGDDPGSWTDYTRSISFGATQLLMTV